MNAPGDLTDPQYWDSRPSRLETGVARGRLADRLRRLHDGSYRRGMARLLGTGVGTDTRFLEIGCAPGWQLLLVHDLHPDWGISGIDSAPKALERTRQVLADAGVDADLAHADLRDYAPETLFDVVLSSGLLEHFTDVRGIVEDHARLARPGGRVAAVIPDFRTWPRRRAFERIDRDGFVTHNLEIMTAGALADVFGQAGLLDVDSGGMCGPQLYLPPFRSSAGVGRKAYALLARAWNLLVALVPGLRVPWNAYLWVRGTVPAERPPAT